MSLTRDDRYIVLALGDHGTLAGRAASPYEPTCALIPFTARSTSNNGSENEVVSANGTVADWQRLREHWKTLFAASLGFPPGGAPTHPVLLLTPSHPSRWTRADDQLAAQFFFEQLASPGLLLAPTALASILGSGGAVTGIVVDVGVDCTDVSVVVESAVLPTAARLLPIGTRAIASAWRAAGAPLQQQQLTSTGGVFDASTWTDRALAADYPGLWSAEPLAAAAAAPTTTAAGPKSPVAMANPIAAAIASGPTATSTDGVPAVPVPTHPAPLIATPDAQAAVIASGLVDAIVAGINDAAAAATSAWPAPGTGFDPAAVRAALAETLVVTGVGASSVRGLAAAVAAQVSVSKGGVTPVRFVARSCPEFMDAYKARPDWIAYLGGATIAKTMFSDYRSFVTREDYNSHGPGIINTKNYGGIVL
ncbi:hypothetical protein BC828DRAFT_418498 [Blastocladiella britannica]|nr:hypothetical protein BC828DRAFT_418498 [Blastocladiella britannica]